MDSASFEDGVVHYSAALSLDPLSADLFIKRSKARAGTRTWQKSLGDADAVRVSYLIYIGANNRYHPRRSNSTQSYLQLTTKEGMQHCLALTPTMRQSMRIMICS